MKLSAPLNREQVRRVRDNLQAALDALDLGAKIEVGSARFSNTEVTFKVDVSVVAASGEVLTREAEHFKQFATMYGLQPSDLGKEFRQGGKLFKVSGLSTRRSKYPVLADHEGKTYKFFAETVRALLRSQEAA